jgi:hypothetical protein
VVLLKIHLWAEFQNKHGEKEDALRSQVRHKVSSSALQGLVKDNSVAQRTDRATIRQKDYNMFSRLLRSCIIL